MNSKIWPLLTAGMMMAADSPVDRRHIKERIEPPKKQVKKDTRSKCPNCRSKRIKNGVCIACKKSIEQRDKDNGNR